MSIADKNQVIGKLHEVKGQIKEAAGEMLDYPELRAEGNYEKRLGKAQSKLGQIEKVFEK